ncbi:DNA-binding protein [Thaumasiovibrio subtropicus]|uniref:DNA-binding protein n=1 Tax=Thaumasiovibrio subtropicus TaxID=1891207 RepID=UPI000B34EF8B|nr:DNA-binding protein [Thaumasiovibrio subtropicus]
MENKEMGVTVTGIIKGARVRVVGAKNTELHELGIVLPRDDGFGGNESQTVIVRLSKDAVQSGMPAHLNSLKGKVCRVPVWVSAWAGNSGAQAQYNLDNARNVDVVEGK